MKRLRNCISNLIRCVLIESVDGGSEWYHGSDHKFTSFGSYKSSGPSALGIFVTDDLNLAELYGDYIYTVRVDIKNPYHITHDQWDDIRGTYAKNTRYFQNMRSALIDDGYDGVYIGDRSWTASNGLTFRDGKIIIVFDKNDIDIVELGY